MEFGIVIMAAGKGTRLKSRRPKVLHEIGGRTLVEHVIAAASQLVEPKDIFVVIGHEAEQVRSAAAHTGVQFVVQAEQRGTGDAIVAAQSAVQDYDNLLVLSGDAPLIRPETLRALRDFHLGQQAAMTILTARPSNPEGYGRVVRVAADRPEVEAIVEQKALTEKQKSAPEINSGIYGFRADALFRSIGELSTGNAHGEYYLTDMAAILRQAGDRVVALETRDVDEVLGANTMAEMMALDAAMRLRTARALMDQGVTIYRPETSVIDSTVTVGADTILEPFVQLLGETRIGSGCRVRSYSVIEDSSVGDDVMIRNGCIVTGAQIASKALLGPYAHVRPESVIGEAAHVGNFVEMKKTVLGAGSKANHLTYLGDAEIGTGVNLGAGTITCNYDGRGKSPTRIGQNVFVGSDATLVAPVEIGDGSYIAAGSTITEDVPPDALALGRSRQTVKPEWAAKLRARRGQG
jgi:bifunctional UDP-N-acetylglucosamine pyrophosphorylase/glucosamine-1-phosphate N-acetyltransferase